MIYIYSLSSFKTICIFWFLGKIVCFYLSFLQLALLTAFEQWSLDGLCHLALWRCSLMTWEKHTSEKNFFFLTRHFLSQTIAHPSNPAILLILALDLWTGHLPRWIKWMQQYFITTAWTLWHLSESDYLSSVNYCGISVMSLLSKYLEIFFISYKNIVSCVWHQTAFSGEALGSMAFPLLPGPLWPSVLSIVK